MHSERGNSSADICFSFSIWFIVQSSCNRRLRRTERMLSEIVPDDRLIDPRALLAVIAKADVLIEGFRPNVMERLNLSPDVCLNVNRKLVFARMTGWGQTGPLASSVGHDGTPPRMRRAASWWTSQGVTVLCSYISATAEVTYRLTLFDGILDRIQRCATSSEYYRDCRFRC
jgi:CoA transferase family III